MPLRPGNLSSLANTQDRPCTDDQLCVKVLEQMLAALDYLALNDICHRDVKPENILYWVSTDSRGYTFQLADFGLANHRLLARTKCGTGYYEAPELYPEYGTFTQSPKMDVWSLFATVIDIHHKFSFPPERARAYLEAPQAVRAAALLEPNLANMVRENPNHRASAAQLLVLHFNGRSLSTPKAQVPPIATPSEPAPQALVVAPAKAAPVGLPLVKYQRDPPRRRPRQETSLPKPLTRRSPFRPLEGGIRKPRAPSYPAVEQSLSHKVPIKKGLEHRKERDQLGTGLFSIPGSFPT